ncbi:carboxylesterase family protein [Flavitalea flava]
MIKKNLLFTILPVAVIFFLAVQPSLAQNVSSSPAAKGYAPHKPKTKYPYLLYLPEQYAKNTKQYPLVIYLHGGSQRGNELNKLKGYGLPSLVARGKKFDFIIASPQCPSDRYWSAENWFDSLYLELREKYRIDTDRVYMTGISIGGFGTFITAMDHPSVFAALVPLCGGCNDSDTSRICNLRNIPIWAFHGTADDKILISETERIVSRLQNCRGNIRFTRLPGAGHGIEGLYETIPDMYTWMLKQNRRKQARKRAKIQ